MEKIELTNEKALELTNEILEEINHSSKAKSSADIGTGMTHQNKIITLEDQTELVLRWIQPGLHPNPARREDSYFGGERSIYREAKLLEIAENQAKIPASNVFYVGDKKEKGKILLVEKVPGILFRTYLENNDFSHQKFLKSLEFLGEDFAKAHSVKFDSYGSIQTEGVRDGKEKYGDYLKKIINRHTIDHLEMLETYFSEKELQEVFDYFNEVCIYANCLDESKVKPSFVLYDQHSRNFMVDDQTGKPSGYFDIEYGQAAHPNLEFGSTALQIFGFFSGNNEKQCADYIKKAKEKFMKGYLKNGGSESINDDTLETIHVANHIFSAIKSYHKKEGVRENWSQKFADMVLGMTREGKVNCYFAFTDLIRSATKQPKQPN